MQQALKQHKQYLLTGVSYVIPMIACGGILIATAIALLTLLHPGSLTPTGGPDFSHAPKLKLILDIGVAAFNMALPVLAGFIAYGMASRPGLVPGLIGGYLAGATNAGFLGALLAGLIAGHVVNLLKKVPVHKYVRPIMPIIVIPIVSSLVVGTVMLVVIGTPIANFMTFLGAWLQTMGQGNAIVLAAILGAMIAFDMGGPVNKAAFFFGAAMIKEGNYAIMGACAAAICTPPLGLALATLVGRAQWTDEQKESGLAALGMGMVGITEGAIPFAAADPVRVIPSIMLGSMVAAAIAMLGGVGDHAPHGGPIVLPVVDNRIVYVVAICAGAAVTALTINVVKRLTEKPAGGL
jgi:fructose PTS system EIIBC or EIIC component